MKLYDSDATQEYLLDGRYLVKPLIKCKDCKHFLRSNEKCELIDTRLRFYETDKCWTEDCFCAWAERREE